MKYPSSFRSQLLIALCFSLPLAALGFRAAGPWGVIAGALVGAVLASRLLRRGAHDASAAHVTAVVIASPDAEDTVEADARRVARLKRDFDAAVIEQADAITIEHTALR